MKHPGWHWKAAHAFRQKRLSQSARSIAWEGFRRIPGRKSTMKPLLLAILLCSFLLGISSGQSIHDNGSLESGPEHSPVEIYGSRPTLKGERARPSDPCWLFIEQLRRDCRKISPPFVPCRLGPPLTSEQELLAAYSVTRPNTSCRYLEECRGGLLIIPESSVWCRTR